MKLIVETVYENVTDEWLDWYISRLEGCKVPVVAHKLKDGAYLSFSSKDPSSEVIATTSYKVKK